MFLCGSGCVCVCFKKRKTEPSWKNQKADAPIIELGKGNRNLVIGVTGPPILINLGCGGAVGFSAQMWGVRNRGGGRRFRCPETLLETKGPGLSPSPVMDSLFWLGRLPNLAVSGGRWAVGATSPPERGRSAAWASPAPTASTRWRLLLSAIYHSDGKTNLKHLEIYVSDGSSCTVPLY